MDKTLAERLEAMAETDLIPMEAACDLLREAARAVREAVFAALQQPASGGEVMGPKAAYLQMARDVLR